MFSSKKIHIVSLAQLNRALGRVSSELHSKGLWLDNAEHVDVYLSPIGLSFGTYGWHATGDAGEIVIPSVSGSKMRDLMNGSYTSLADILRHEYGHALANLNKGLIRSAQFSDAFGASYDNADEFDYDPDFHVSEYAATNASEDFAETFMLYLKRAGKLSSQLDTPAIRVKWKFIHRFCSNVRRGKTRWAG